MNKKAVASVLRRMGALQPRDRIALCRALGTAWHDPRALDALLELTRDPDRDVQRAARVALSEERDHLPPDVLLELAAQSGEKRREFLRSWQARYSDVKGLRASPRNAAIVAHAQQLHEEPAFSILRDLAAARDDLANTAAEALGLLVDVRVADELFRLAMAERHAALIQLARRGDARAFDPLVEWGRGRAKGARDDFDRRREL